MIIDSLPNWRQYRLTPAWDTIFNFLTSLTPSAEEKEYPLQDRDIYAKIMSYTTRLPEQSKLEAHRQYVDIQMPLLGADGIECHPLDGLKIDKPYDEKSDAILFIRPGAPFVAINLIPRQFAILFPQDVHAPGLALHSAPSKVKKAVVKVRTNLLIN
ncbi:MAG: YhcH/YjgK/YiaL family protein [Verrucomicrobiae bacterium]|nr:YhcH/YjgK/YiaL family protein [Verrucomicrobiae bacterium]